MADRGRGAWVRGHPYGHLWYLYVLVGLYGITPLLQPFVQSASRRTLAWAVAVLLAAVSAHSLISTFTAGDGKPTIFSMFVAFIPYYLCGYLLSLVVRAAPLGQVPDPWQCWGWPGNRPGHRAFFSRVEFYLSTHHSVLIILLSAGTFLLASGLFGQKGSDHARSWKVLRYLDGLSFGVYLVHPLFLFVVMRFGCPTEDMLGQPLLWIPVLFRRPALRLRTSDGRSQGPPGTPAYRVGRRVRKQAYAVTAGSQVVHAKPLGQGRRWAEARFVRYTPDRTRTAPTARDHVIGSCSMKNARITAEMGTKLMNSACAACRR